MAKRVNSALLRGQKLWEGWMHWLRVDALLLGLHSWLTSQHGQSVLAFVCNLVRRYT